MSISLIPLPPPPAPRLAQLWVQDEDIWLQMGVHHATVDMSDVESTFEAAAARRYPGSAETVNSMRCDDSGSEPQRGGGKGGEHGDKADGVEEPACRSSAGETSAISENAPDEVRRRALTFQRSLQRMVDSGDGLGNGSSSEKAQEGAAGVEPPAAKGGGGGWPAGA